MSVSDLYGIYGVHLNGTLLGGVTQVDDEYENSVQDDALSGEAFARFLALVAQKARASFATRQLKRLLDTVRTVDDGIPMPYSNLAATVWGAGLRFYWQKKAAGGSQGSGAVHLQDKVAAGLIAVQRITCEHQGDAAAQCDVLPASDGSNELIARTFNVALPGGLLDDQRYSLGPVTLGGVAFTEFTSLEIALGFEMKLRGSESEIVDRFAFWDRVRPTILLRGLDLGWYQSAKIPTNGLLCTHANSKVYLRKRAQGASFVANGTAEHLSATADGTLTVGKIGGAGSGAESEIVAMLKCRFDGTNAPLLFNTATAIT
jgi:hypothetical protein